MLAARVVAHAHACACAHARQLACTMSSHARAGNKEGANTEVVIAMGSNMVSLSNGFCLPHAATGAPTADAASRMRIDNAPTWGMDPLAG